MHDYPLPVLLLDRNGIHLRTDLVLNLPVVQILLFSSTVQMSGDDVKSFGNPSEIHKI